MKSKEESKGIHNTLNNIENPYNLPQVQILHVDDDSIQLTKKDLVTSNTILTFLQLHATDVRAIS